ncbi:DUF6191 domain-containing protein [Streptomyces sp. NPDC002466]|uniref:DUF6191 domain-containing protein n=1 Tax=Streptomyces sp. NPDC002466 TaxID=3364646 RepID=UPI00368E463F
MQFIAFMTLPGLVIVLTLLAFVDQLLLRAGRAGVLPWRNGARQGQISATGFEQLHASLSPGKQNELKERQSALIMPDNEDDGGPDRGNGGRTVAARRAVDATSDPRPYCRFPARPEPVRAPAARARRIGELE